MTISGCVKKIREEERKVIMTDGTEIPFDEITEIDDQDEDIW